MTKNPLLNAAAATVYIFLIASVLYYGPKKIVPVDSVIVPIIFLSLFVLSAALMGYFFLYQPARLLIEDKQKEAVKLFLVTVVIFAGITGVMTFAGIEFSHPWGNPTPTILTFEDCVKAGYQITGNNPRQCKTPDGRTYAEEIAQKAVYRNASENIIKVETPFPGAVTGKDFSVIGQARGTWFFEASFPIELLDKNGNLLAVVVAQAQSDWMTEDFVPFKADMKVPQSYIGPATLILKKDNPSGIPANDASVSFPITVEY